MYVNSTKLMFKVERVDCICRSSSASAIASTDLVLAAPLRLVYRYILSIRLLRLFSFKNTKNVFEKSEIVIL